MGRRKMTELEAAKRQYAWRWAAWAVENRLVSYPPIGKDTLEPDKEVIRHVEKVVIPVLRKYAQYPVKKAGKQ